MTKHKHADLMLLYAQDALETDKPWTRWEMLVHDKWAVLTSNPTWHEALEYRRKPQTILVNGIEVPKPETRAPKYDTLYWVPDLKSKSFFDCFTWCNDDVDFRHLERRIVHLNNEAAAAHGKALTKYRENNDE